MSLLSNRCLPHYLLNADPRVLVDVQYDDFDEQAQQLVGHDQSYIQLSSGPFSGRFLSCFLNPNVSIHIEHCNQALEQTVIGHPDAFSIAVIINEHDRFRPNGRSFSASDVLFLPPKGNLHICSSVNGAILAVVVQKDFLLGQAGLSQRAVDFLNDADADTDIRLLHAPQLADRIREDVVQAVESASQVGCSPDAATVSGTALTAGISAKLSLELSRADMLSGPSFDSSYERFFECRESIIRDWDKIHDMESLLWQTNTSRRSLQQSFKTQVETGPLAYHRIIRLHMARRALLDSELLEASIGDVAAEHGFWNWSQFTQHYRNHFGELPSQTRMNIGKPS